jgi:undecaprenyl-diphosphatase
MGDDGTSDRRGEPGRDGPPPAGLDRHLPRRSRRRVHPVGLVVVLALAAAAALATAFVGVGPALADRAVLGEVLDLRTGPLTWFAVVITQAGSTVAMGGLAGLVALWLLRRSRTADAVFVIATAAGAALLFNGFKWLLDRPRPPLVDRLVGVGNESLPSGHATMSAAVIGSLVVLAWAGRSVAARLAIAGAGAAWVVAVGLTRIYLGVHWFSDVLAGWLLGGAWLAVCAVVSAALARRRAAAPG